MILAEREKHAWLQEINVDRVDFGNRSKNTYPLRFKYQNTGNN